MMRAEGWGHAAHVPPKQYWNYYTLYRATIKVDHELADVDQSSIPAMADIYPTMHSAQSTPNPTQEVHLMDQ